MTIEVGTKVAGKVSGITNFGAFVDLGDHKSGLVHISEVSNGFVKDIHDVLTIGDEVKVKVLSVADDGKIALSIRKAEDHPVATPERRQHSGHEQKSSFKPASHDRPRNNFHSSNRHSRNNDQKEGNDFDSLLSGFLKDSESRLSTLKKNTEGKRGGRGGRRS